MFDQQIAEKHINSLLKNYKIKVVKRSKSSCGRANSSTHEVIIPHPTDVDRFCVCLHEIKHIIDGTKGKLYQREYACEKYAIEEAEKLGFDTSMYRERARRYVILCISKAHCRHLNLKEIPQEIKDFCNIDFSTWESRNVFVSNWGSKSYTEPLQITIS